ncbi:MAG: hypothetical protein HOB17_04560 [Candidatus Marinimicrobia bacterium]|jgi:hypothetical protein|nr:hypothetical protein [Candidatus Neomarinimicrobiota bacterium]MBT3683858.1 hypothetical protein [Candidatus Neomarinimicrobiota bacterium]MBT3760840.1 hypothetical protein [Candidatus Neomarinimicrobiota bacterium]MBT3896866.1 hypothetical protein [Candidatus Neomarinimicrobiota bacterium]MBT4538564.1 hypothetical protein [Candidatus Neomarinimicrobiota bacterium]
MNLNRYKSLVNYRFILSLSLLLIISLFLFANTRDQLGDVNNDGEIDVQDIVLVVDIILNDDIEYGEYELWASDVNLDGVTDVVDVILIVQVIIESNDCPNLYSPCSENLSLCCMDTTSHDYTWVIDTLGTNGSYLRDVAIVDENNIWVVGNIETDDAEYNAAHWNGTEWVLFGIYSNTLNLYRIKYFSENDIWVTSFGFPIHWNGTDWTLYHLQNMGIHVSTGYGIWGTSSSNIYFVGHQGAIVYYDGENFEQMDSGTEVDLLNIWGTYNDETGSEIIWTSGHDSYGNSVFLVYTNGMWHPVYDVNSYKYVFRPDSLSGTIGGLWSSDNDLYVYTTWGIYQCPISTVGEGEIIWLGENGDATEKILGTNDNNLFFYRSGSEIRHFNGSTWHLYDEIINPLDVLNSIDVRENLAVTVGYRYYNPIERWAVIMRGVRN